jgi:RND family efflux transporter MFP subunit
VDALLFVGLENACWAAVLAVLAAVGVRVFRRRPAVAHALWILVLLKLLLPSFLRLELLPARSAWEQGFAGASTFRPLDAGTPSNGGAPFLSPPRGEAESPDSIGGARRADEGVGEKVPEERMRGSDRFTGATASVRVPALAGLEINASESTARTPAWKQAVLAVWLVGSAAFWSFVALATFRFRRLLRLVPLAPPEVANQASQVAAHLGLKRVPRVWIVPARIPPMIWAAMAGRPRLLLPQELWGRFTTLQQDAVLAHEMAHLKRRDQWVRRLETVVIGLYWWFPIAWWARRQLEESEEKCCDAWVLWAMPGAAHSYAEALVATAALVSGHRPALPAGAMGAGRVMPIQRRLNMLLDDASPRRIARSAPPALLVLGILALPFLPLLASGQPLAAPQAAPASAGGEDSARAIPEQQVKKAAPQSAPTKRADIWPETPGAPVRIRAVQAIEREVRDYVDASGFIQAARMVDLRARVSGHLIRVSFAPGQMVQQGDRLFEIDARPYQSELDRASAEVQRAEARLKTCSTQADLTRKLADTATVSQERVLKAEGDMEEAKAAVQAARAAHDLARLKLEYTRITAPFAGKIGEPRLSPGNVVVADTTSLATLISVQPIYVFFNVTQGTFFRLARLKREGKLKAGLEPGVAVQVTVPNAQEPPRRGKVHFVDSRVDPGNRTIRCGALVENPDGLLMPGMFASVRLETSAPRAAVLVPEQAIVQNQGQNPRLFVVTSDNRIDVRQLSIGFAYDGARVVEAAVKVGEWIVLDPREPMPPRVEPEKVPWPSSGVP